MIPDYSQRVINYLEICVSSQHKSLINTTNTASYTNLTRKPYVRLLAYLGNHNSKYNKYQNKGSQNIETLFGTNVLQN